MPQKIKGNIGEAGRILVFDESDFTTIEVNEVVGAGGAFNIEVPTSGVKMVLARSASGEVIGYGAMSSVFEAPSEFTQNFTIPAQSYACGYQTSNVISNYNSNTVVIGSYTGRHYNPWFWVPNITIAQGSTIHSAKLKTHVTNTLSKTLTCAACINLDDNATPPYSSSQWASKVKSTETSFTMNTSAGTVYTWPEMASHLQQVVNRPGWASGNAVMLFFREASYQRTGAYHGTGFGAQNSGYSWPTLTINWTIPG
jgi:hypothetical protein